MFSWFFTKTVSSVTAEFDRIVQDLEEIEKKAIAKVDFHARAQTWHAGEAITAARIGVKIKELIS